MKSSISSEQYLSKRQLREKIKNKEYQRLDDNTKLKLINKEEMSIGDTIKNPIIIKNKLGIDMISAMKKKDSFSLGVIRMAKGAVSLEAINKKRDLTDEEVVDVIVKQIKLRKDAILESTKANRMDLVSQNEKEIEVLNKYLKEFILQGGFDIE